MKAANIRKPHTLAFCQEVVAGGEPVYVRLQKVRGAERLECFKNVTIAMEALGGSMVIGWAIWEWPRVMIEAEFHAVLRLPDGKLIDVTPVPNAAQKIAFVEDPDARDEGQRLDNIRKSLQDDPDIEHFIELAKRKFELTNETDVSDQGSYIQLSEKKRQLANEIIRVLEVLESRYG